MPRVLTLCLLLALSGVLCLAGPAEAKERTLADKELAAKIRTAIDRGATRLQVMRSKSGLWPYDGNAQGTPPPGRGRPRVDPHGSAGLTALSLYALSSSGVHAGAEAIKQGVAWTVANPAGFAPQARYATYAASFLLLALARISPEAHGKRIAALADQLVASQVESGPWSYGTSAQGVEALGDHSNTQLAVLALWTAQEVSAYKVPKAVWTKVRAHFVGSQLPGGGWGYRASKGRRAGGTATKAKPAMTAAGLCSYLLASAALKGGRKALPGVRKDKVVTRALEALGKPALDGADPYLAWLLERAYVLADRPLPGWYVPGARALLARQDKSGGWRTTPRRGQPSYGDRRGAYETALALLFLTRASRGGTTGR